MMGTWIVVSFASWATVACPATVWQQTCLWAAALGGRRCHATARLDLLMLLAQIVQFYKGKKLSANLPYKVQFQIPLEDGAKPVKLIAHLVRSCPPTDT